MELTTLTFNAVSVTKFRHRKSVELLLPVHRLYRGRREESLLSCLCQKADQRQRWNLKCQKCEKPGTQQ